MAPLGRAAAAGPDHQRAWSARAREPGGGQKTGYYLDQRDNRPGGRFLHRQAGPDVFCYSGGFGLHAAKAGAQEVLGLDASEPALELARRNAAANELTNVAVRVADVFHHLADLVAIRRQFDVVILDPPKFARNRGAVPEALKGYRRLHRLALLLARRRPRFVLLHRSYYAEGSKT